VKRDQESGMLRWIIGNQQRKRRATMDLEDFSLTEEEEEFFISANETAEMMKTLSKRGVSQSAAIGGALTQLLTQLFVGSTSQAEALGILSSCLSQAADNSDKFESLLSGLIESDSVH